MRKHLIRYAAIVGVLAAPIAAAAPASATTTGGTSSAYGLSATGLLAIPQIPSVDSAAAPYVKSVVSVPNNPLVQLSVLKASAIGGHSETSVVDLKVAQAAIIKTAVLSAKVITSQCDNGVGSSKLVDVMLAGHAIQVGVSPNSTVTVPVQGVGGVQVTINKQARNPDGSLTVTGLELAVQALGKAQVIDIASATCVAARSSASAPGTGDPSNPPSPPGEAPAPTPVNSDLPVTG
jgi:hypothetical protein